MTMPGFQKAMCDLVASPDLCVRLVQSPEEVLARYDLSDRDRRRLVEVVQQPGMVVNCSLYRANRLTLIFNLLPLTCFLLGDKLMNEATEFWRSFEETRLQYNEEVERFGDFLRHRIELGAQRDPILAEVLEYELAVNRVRFSARLEILAGLQSAKATACRTSIIRLHPLIRVLLFRHEPERLLELLTEQRPPPYELAHGEFWLLLDGTGEELVTKSIAPDIGRLLAAIGPGSELSLSAEDVETLIDSGLAVASST
jgi:hypothetical protein